MNSKITLFFKTFVVSLLLIVSSSLFAQNALVDGQSTEGKDFWVTFLQADAENSKDMTLSLTISAQEACEVYFQNEYSGYLDSIHIDANSIAEVELYKGTAQSSARNRDKVVCYSFNYNMADTSAVHVWSTANISLFASNYKDKSFDATNVLPTPSLLDEYYIQTYPPTAHADGSQGSHFCIVATEDNTVIDYIPTVRPKGVSGWTLRDTLTTDTLKRGQVWYVWTGKGSGDSYDFSGTYVKARDGKRIAVFQGCPHTNIPLEVRDRDHVFSQAMPTQYWGNTFVITSSVTRKRDKVRIMALHDDTQVYIGDSLVHTFDFATNPKRTFEFEIGELNVTCTDGDYKDNYGAALPAPLVEGTSCVVTASCPISTHLFMVSNRYDGTPDGDPAMLWINPIEQMINQITFTTFKGDNTHYFNVVTDSANVKTMTLDGKSIAADFQPVNGNSTYWFARKNISHTNHTLKGEKGFIAHVYGYGEKESYAYSAGGATKTLTQAITINGETYTSEGSSKPICGSDGVLFECKLDFAPESITWGFGDGSPEETGESVYHEYADGTWNAYCIIERTSTNLCAGQTARDSIPLKVIIGQLTMQVDSTSTNLCPEDTEFFIWYSSSDPLDFSKCQITFNDAAEAVGFSESSILDKTVDYFRLAIPAGITDAQRGPDNPYGLDIFIDTECEDIDTTLTFYLSKSAAGLIEQRWNMLAFLNQHNDTVFSSFQWYEVVGDETILIEGDTTAILNLSGKTDDGQYLVCYEYKIDNEVITECSCPITYKGFNENDSVVFGSDITVSTLTLKPGFSLYVTTSAAGTAEWINITGDILETINVPEGGMNIMSPSQAGLYILRVTVGDESKNFKVLVLG